AGRRRESDRLARCQGNGSAGAVYGTRVSDLCTRPALPHGQCATRPSRRSPSGPSRTQRPYRNRRPRRRQTCRRSRGRGRICDISNYCGFEGDRGRRDSRNSHREIDAMISNPNLRKVWLTERISSLTDSSKKTLFSRSSSSGDAVAVATAALLDAVRLRGDKALSEMARDFDGVGMAAFEIARPAWRAALDSLDRSLVGAMERSIRNLESV